MMYTCTMYMYTYVHVHVTITCTCMYTLHSHMSAVHSVGIEKLPHALQLLLLIPEASGLSLPTTTATTEPQLSTSPTTVVPPNCYLVCRLFCTSPHTKTNTVWASTDPHFNFKQVIIPFHIAGKFGDPNIW